MDPPRQGSAGSHSSLVIAEGQVQRHDGADGAASPLPMLGVGGSMKLKKEAVWGKEEPGKKSPPPPTRGVVGRSCTGDAGGTKSPRPNSSTPVRNGEGSSPLGGKPRVLSGGSGTPASCGAPASVSNVTLTLETPGRHLVSTIPMPPHQQRATPQLRAASEAAGGGAPSGAPSSLEPTPPSMRIVPAFPSPQPPPHVARGGPQEIEWVHAQLAEGLRLYDKLAMQLQRAQQESVAIRSSLLAQQQNAADTLHEPGTPGAGLDDEGGANAGTPRRGSISSLVALGPKGSDQSFKTKDRKQRKRGVQLGDEREAEADDGAETAIVHAHPKPEETEMRMLASLSKKPPFDRHEEVYLQHLIAAMAPCEVEAGVDVRHRAAHQNRPGRAACSLLRARRLTVSGSGCLAAPSDDGLWLALCLMVSG